MSRREFHGASASALCLPWASHRMATREPPYTQSSTSTLIVVELVGGNDGLNTVIPAADPSYRRARPTLSRVLEGSHPIDNGCALHPSMKELHQLYERGDLAIVQSVGITPPDRSHFRSRDIWHTGDPTLDKLTAKDTGWLGRLGDALLDAGAKTPTMALGQSRLPLCLLGRDHTPPLLNDPESLRLERGADPAGARVTIGGGEPEDNIESFLGELADQARELEQRLQRAFESYQPEAQFLRGEGGSFGQSLSSIVRLIAADFGTRVFHVPIEGFDTHSRQVEPHSRLLKAVSEGLGALAGELGKIGVLEQTTVLVYSEFGRRVGENDSEGTDHGAGAPCLVLGGGVRGGMHGEPPDLIDLLDGDIRPTTDFRRMHRSLVERLGTKADRVLDLKTRDQKIEALPLFP